MDADRIIIKKNVDLYELFDASDIIITKQKQANADLGIIEISIIVCPPRYNWFGLSTCNLPGSVLVPSQLSKWLVAVST